MTSRDLYLRIYFIERINHLRLLRKRWDNLRILQREREREIIGLLMYEYINNLINSNTRLMYKVICPHLFERTPIRQRRGKFIDGGLHEFGDRSSRKIPISQLTFEFNGVWRTDAGEVVLQADKGQKKHPEEGVKRGRSEGGQGKRPGGGLSERDKLLR